MMWWSYTTTNGTWPARTEFENREQAMSAAVMALPPGTVFWTGCRDTRGVMMQVEEHKV